jgi:TonB-linked SusC/RagA family outer membrane protein
MKPLYCLNVLALLALSNLSCPAQTVATSRHPQRLPVQTVTLKLRDALQELKGHYGVDILYADRVVRNVVIPAASLNWKLDLEQNLSNILHPHHLTFSRQKGGSYVLTPMPKDQSGLPFRTIPDKNKAWKEGPSQTNVRLPGPIRSQEQEISGKVTDERGEGLPGVSVLVKGTQRGTTTDPDGRYALKLSDGDSWLVFSYVGYSSQEIQIGQKASVDVVLTPDNKALDEVVVVGYGTQQKKDLTGAVSTVSARNITERQSVQVSDALQGAMAGVTVSRNSGGPGTSSTIRVRGVTTIGNNDALIIVDGVPNDNIDNLNPNDIENITVLKDAASAAIYGSRAAAGVVLVTTKRAKDGQSSLEYTYEAGVQTPTQLPAYVDAVRYMQLFNEYRTNDGSTPFYTQPFIDSYWQNHQTNPDLYPATNWQKTVLERYAPRQRHDLSFTIGTEKLKTRASFNYSLVDGLFRNRSFDRYTVKINNDLQISKSLSANLDVSYVRGKNLTTTGENPVNNARLLPDIYGAVYQDGRWAPGKDGRNPLAQITEGGTDKSIENQLVGRLAFNFKPIPGLSLMSVLAPAFKFDKTKVFSKVVQFTDLDNPSRVLFTNQANTTLNESRSEGFTINGQLLANYSRQFGEHHNVDGLIGYEENYLSYELLQASRGAFAITNFPYLNLGSTELRDNAGTAYEAALRSFFARVKYDFRNKYYVQANIRRDGSSRFRQDRRWGVFPSFSAGWTISEEAFFKNVPVLSFLKLRGSWGQVGNERIGNYPYQSSIIFDDVLFYKGGLVSSETRAAQRQYAVQDISWETTESMDLGLDANLFNGRFSVSGDFYQKKTRDILLMLDIPIYMGYENPNQNAGTVSARGWDLEMNWKDNLGALRYSVGANLSDVKTRIVDLKGTQILGNQAQLEGGEFNEWYGYRSAGLFQTADEVKSSPVLNANTKPGDVKFMDINGDGKITSDGDRVLLGGSLPRYTYGANLRLDYKGFDFTMVVQGVGKVKSRLSDVQVKPFLSQYGNVPAEIDGRFWSLTNSAEDNLQARYPRLSSIAENNNYAMSDFWLINGSYFRLKNLTIGYNVPSTLSNRLKIRGLRVYASANDLFSFNHFPKGWDPEVAVANYPIVKTFMAGVTIRL